MLYVLGILALLIAILVLRVLRMGKHHDQEMARMNEDRIEEQRQIFESERKAAEAIRFVSGQYQILEPDHLN